jgi:predicted DNA-binding antitoxin AbrB/MazE fold protein
VEQWVESKTGDVMTVRAIYENGVFKPVEPVSLPEKAEVEVNLPEPGQSDQANQEAIFAILRESYSSGESDVAERHNEHQP